MEILELKADKTNLEKMLDFIIENYSGYIKDKKTLYRLKVASEEALMNIINYAYQGDNGDICITFEYIEKSNYTVLSIKDKGIAFNPLKVGEPDLKTEVENREVGGLGVFMIKKLMDKVAYERKDNTNILTLTKNV